MASTNADANVDANANAASHQRLLRVHEAAGLALLQYMDASSGVSKSKWVPHASPSLPSDSPRTRAGGAGRLDLDRLPSACGRFQLVPPPRGVAQNLLVFLHGRGDSHEPFAKLGATMALPQTGQWPPCSSPRLASSVVADGRLVHTQPSCPCARRSSSPSTSAPRGSGIWTRPP